MAWKAAGWLEKAAKAWACEAMAANMCGSAESALMALALEAIAVKAWELKAWLLAAWAAIWAKALGSCARAVKAFGFCAMALSAAGFCARA